MALTVEKLIAEIDANPDGAIAALSALNKELDLTARDRTAKIEVKTDTSQVDQAKRSMEQGSASTDILKKAVGGLGSAFGLLGKAVTGVRFGAFYAGATMASGALQGLAAIAGGAVGALGNLAGLIGTIPAGLAAIGGGVAAAALGFAGITKAVSAYTAVQQQNTAGTLQAVQRADQLTQARHALTQATQSVADAEYNLKQARIALSKAPYEAHVNLVNLRDQAAQATLNEKNAVLQLQQAQENLNNIQNQTAMSSFTLIKQTDDFTGKVYEVAQSSQSATDAALKEQQAQIQVKQAQLGVTQAKHQNAQAQHDLNYAERQGIKNSDIMKSARHGVLQAEQALRNAIWSHKNAQHMLNEQIKFGTAATQAYQQAIMHLSPVAQQFVHFLVNKFLPAFYQMRDIAQKGLLPGVEKGLNTFMRLFPMLDKHVYRFARTIGGAFSKFMTFWTKPQNARLLDKTLGGANRLLGEMVKIGQPLSKILVSITKAATPMTRHLTHDVLGAIRGISHWMDSAGGKKGMANFFHQAYRFSKDWAGVLKPIIGIFAGITKAATPLAHWILKNLGGYLQGVSDSINSITGQKSLTSYFDAQKPALKAFGTLVKDIGGALMKKRDNTGFVNTLRALDKYAVPALSKIIDALSKSNFGPAFAQFLGHLGDGIAALVQRDGPLTLLVKTLNNLADAFDAVNKKTHGRAGKVVLGAMTAAGVVGIGEHIPLASQGIDKAKELGSSFLDDKIKQIIDDRLGKHLNPLKIATPVEVVNWPPGFGSGGANPADAVGAGTKQAEKDAAKQVEKKGLKKYGAWIASFIGTLASTGTAVTYGPLLAAGGDQGGRRAMSANLNHHQKATYNRQAQTMNFLESVIKGLHGRVGTDTALTTLLGKNPDAGIQVLQKAAQIYGGTLPQLLKWLNVSGGEFETSAKKAQKYESALHSQASLTNLLLLPSQNKLLQALAKMPPQVQTKIETPGAVTSMADIMNLQKKYKLTPGQVKTLIKLEGWQSAIKNAQNLHDELVSIQNLKDLKINASFVASIKKHGPIAGGGHVANAIPHAEGGSVRKGQTYLVGERRAELFTAPADGRIIPRPGVSSTAAGITEAQFERILNKVLEAAKGDQSITVNTTNEAHPLHVAKEIAWSLR